MNQADANSGTEPNAPGASRGHTGARPMRRPTRVLLFVLVIALAATLRLATLGEQSVWLDEAMTAFDANLPANELWFHKATNKPPLYYHLTSLFWSTGDGEYSLRLPAAIIGIACVALAWWLGYRLLGMGGAILLGTLTGISDVALQFSQEARSYTLLAAGWVCMLLGYAGLLQLSTRASARRSRDALLLFIGAVLMIHANPISFVYWIAAATTFTLIWRRQDEALRTPFRIPLSAGFAAFLTLAPWLPVLVRLLGSDGEFNWLQQASATEAWSIFGALFGASRIPGVGETLGPLLVIASSAGLVGFALRRDLDVGVFLIGCLFLPAVAIWITGFVYKPVFMLRTVMPLQVLAILGLACCVYLLRRSWAKGTLGAVLVVTFSASSLGYFQDFEKRNWRGAAQHLRTHAKTDDVLYVCKPHHPIPLDFYLRNELPTTVGPRPTRDDDRANLAEYCADQTTLRRLRITAFGDIQSCRDRACQGTVWTAFAPATRHGAIWLLIPGKECDAADWKLLSECLDVNPANSSMHWQDGDLGLRRIPAPARSGGVK